MSIHKFKVVSLFSGAGGLDQGFLDSGKFEIVWANDNDPSVYKTFIKNHPKIAFNSKNITKVASKDIPKADIIIGGPPCQSWSVAGSNRGAKDTRGQLFYEYIRIINDLKPKMFVAENVEGIMRKTHQVEFQNIVKMFNKVGYTVHSRVLNAADYEVPQDRKRAILVGIHNKYQVNYAYPQPINPHVTLKKAISDLADLKIAAVKRTDPITDVNSYLDDTWSSQFMSRNRVRSWDDISYTIPATARQIPLHPQAPKMIKISRDDWSFDYSDPNLKFNGDNLYRRFTVKESARIQTFPDNYQFVFDKVEQAYKQIGNAVPVKLAYHLAISVNNALENLKPAPKKQLLSIKPKKKTRCVLKITRKKIVSGGSP